jgi:hypothetical protein
VQRVRRTSGALVRGPFEWPVLGSTLQVLALGDGLYDYMLEQAKKVRALCAIVDRRSASAAYIDAPQDPTGSMQLRVTGDRFLVLSDPESVRHVLQQNFANYPKGKYMRTMYSRLLGTGTLRPRLPRRVFVDCPAAG